MPDLPTPDEMTYACARCGEGLKGIGAGHACESRKQLRERAERAEREADAYRFDLELLRSAEAKLAGHVRVRREVATEIRTFMNRENPRLNLRGLAARLEGER